MSEPEAPLLGPYRLGRLLGEGGMGSVWEAYDARLDRRVAVKRVHPRLDGREGVRQRLRREAWAAARLSHPSIVPIFDVLETDGVDWIVMELVEGQTLAQHLEDATRAEASIPVDRAVDWAAQIAGGLAAAHAAGIIHRDLKTENVMIDGGSRIRILDFGLAKPLESDDASLTAPGEVRGTARSMSPEQARGNAVDERSDLFSLGVLLYETLTGLSPFRAADSLTSMTRVCTLQQVPAHELRTEVTVELSQFVDHLLEKDPAHRPDSAAAVKRVLQDFRGSATPSGDLFSARLEPSTRSSPGVATPSVESAATIGPLQAAVSAPTEAVPVPQRNEPTGPSSPSVQAVPATDSVSGEPSASRRWNLAAGLALALLGVVLGLVLLLGSGALAPGGQDSEATTAGASGRFAGAALEAGTPGATVDSITREEGNSIARGGLALLDDGLVDDAVRTFERALSTDPTSALAHAGLARAYWARYRGEGLDPAWLDRAETVARVAVERDGHLVRAQVILALVAIERGRFDEAREGLETAAILAPGDPDMLRARGDLARAQGDLDTALDAYRQALERRPVDRELHDLVGSLHFQRADYAAAEASFRSALASEPESAPTLRNLASALMLQGDTEEAASLLQRSLEILPTPSAYANLGVLLYGEGLYDRAANAFRQAIDTGSGTLLYLHWANLGDALYWAGQRPEALDAYSHARDLLTEQIGADGGRPESRVQLALLQAKLGERDAARTLLAALDPARDDSVAHYLMAIAFERLGDPAAATASLDRAIEAGYPIEEVLKEPELAALRERPAWSRRVAQRASTELKGARPD